MLIEQSEDGDPVMQQEPCKSKAIVAYMSGVNSEKLAVKIFVGAGAWLLFYPTLFYNVIRNKFESEFRWWDHIEQFFFSSIYVSESKDQAPCNPYSRLSVCSFF